MAAAGEWVWELFQWAGGNRAGSTSSSQTRVTSSATAGQNLGLVFDLEVEPSCLGTPDPETHGVNTSLSLSLCVAEHLSCSQE